MIEINVDQEANAKNITMGGNLTVEHAAEMMATFRDALTVPIPDIELTLGAVTKVDVAFLQLLCSTHRTAAESGKTFIVERFHQEPMTRALRTMGFNWTKGCSCDPTQSCVFVRMSA
jgi:ABC-type transporter Mla MlaB component